MRSRRCISAATSRPRRANARRLLEGQPFTFDDLLPERLPALVETTVPADRYVDAVTARGLASLDLPATYPRDARGRLGAARALPADRQRPPGRRASRASPAAAPPRAHRPAARSSRSSTAAGASGEGGGGASIAGTAGPERRCWPHDGAHPTIRRGVRSLRNRRGDPAARRERALRARHPARLDATAARDLDDLDDALVRRARLAVGERRDLEPRARDRADARPARSSSCSRWGAAWAA